jgi:hypothetical protein
MERFVTDTLPMIKGWAYLAWQIENDAAVMAHATGPRYIAQEVEKLLNP